MKKKSEELSMAVNPKNQKGAKALGLCENCKSKGGCGYLHDANEPIQFCEEYETEETAPKRKLSLVKNDEMKAQDNSDKAAQKFKGLCVNCEKRDSCTLPKSKGGVWHCEEYE